MRPIELTIEGFRSYRDAASFNFEGRTLLGIVGPTGAGKSSILDALVYALYGKTPKFEKETRRLINTSTDEAKVKLLFEVDDKTWEVTRVIRPKGNSPVVLRNYGDDRVEASGARAVDDRIEQLLGMDFRAFTSSVTLPQGEFDRFLSASPAERARVLKGVFRLERVDALRDLVRERRIANEVRLTAVQAWMEAIPNDPEGQIKELRTQLGGLEERLNEIREAVPQESRLEREFESCKRDLDVVSKEEETMAAAFSRIPDTPELEDLATLESAQSHRYEQVAADVEECRQKAEVAELEASKAKTELGGPTLNEIRDLIRDLDRLGGEEKHLEEELSQANSEADAARSVVARANEAVIEAEESFRGADQKVHAAHQQHAAHILRKSLELGEPCPVCEQSVEKIPASGRAPAIDSAEKARASAEKTLAVARRDLDGGGRDLSRLEERVRKSESEKNRIRENQAAALRRAEEVLGKGVDLVAEFVRREKILEQRDAAAKTARTYLEEVLRREGSERAALEAVQKRRMSFTEILIGLSAGLGIESPTFEDDAQTLVGIAKRISDEILARLARIEASRAELSTRIDSIEVSLLEIRKRFDLQEGQTAADAVGATSRLISAAEEQVIRLEEFIRQRVELVAERAALESTKQNLDLLFSDLGDSKFPAYLLEGHRRLLSELGSEKLLSLTERYCFDDDGSFDIVDTVNDVRRSPDTLSGGEAFLASLALALALAEAVSSRGGRLDCFFLDEGFGSLDSASLDLALEGIEALSAPGRLIGLISHVGGIQTRLDDLIVLDRADDGSTRVEQTEGPIGYAPTI